MKKKIFISKEAKIALRNPKYRTKVIQALEDGAQLAEIVKANNDNFTTKRLKQGF